VLNNAGYTLTGAGTVNGIPGSGGGFAFLVGGSDRKLTVKAGGVLTVPGTNSGADKRILVVTVAGENPGIVGEPAADGKNAAQIALAAYGCIDIYASGSGYSGSTGSIGHNFYDNGGSKVKSNSLRNKNYTWNATAGGDGKPGWKADS
jgi:hypothetical protein